MQNFKPPFYAVRLIATALWCYEMAMKIFCFILLGFRLKLKIYTLPKDYLPHLLLHFLQ